jgi:CheY-like chemotaxis protein
MASQQPYQKILVVDDLNENREFFRMILERDGWTVLEASDGSQIQQILIRETPDIVLLDYNMPFMNGIEACRVVKDTPSIAHIPIVMYSGLSDSSLRQRAIDAGCEDFLVKPMSITLLRETLLRVFHASKTVK